MPETPDAKLAVLIDADNAQPAGSDALVAEIAKFGVASVKRVYGDWTTPNLRGWKDAANKHAIQPIQQFAYTTGKNATDSAMIIDAMDIMHSGVVDGFCLVSSDSDYTRLATRIRETGIFVMGIGEKKTPKAFVNACDLFVYTENLVEEKKATQQKQSNAKRIGKSKAEKEEPDPMPILTQAFEMTVGQDGWARLDTMGNNLYQLDPSFDPRTYGQKQLSRLIKSLKDQFEMRTQEIAGAPIIFVRIKE